MQWFRVGRGLRKFDGPFLLQSTSLCTVSVRTILSYFYPRMNNMMIAILLRTTYAIIGSRWAQPRDFGRIRGQDHSTCRDQTGRSR